jgi:hypothetical protein
MFCQSCGKALPAAEQAGPRVIGTNEFASTASGQRLQIGELERQVKKASGALLTVAIIQTVVGLLALGLEQAVANRVRPATEAAQNLLLILTLAAFVVAAAFFCLYSWSQTQPLPAAIIGLVVYGTLVCLNIFVTCSRLSTTSYSSSHRGSFGGIGVGWVDIVIISILCRAISAGSTHSKLLKSAAAGSGYDTTSPGAALQ